MEVSANPEVSKLKTPLDEAVRKLLLTLVVKIRLMRSLRKSLYKKIYITYEFKEIQR